MSTIEYSPFEERRNPIIGRYLVAKKDLSARELVFKEAPLAVYSKFNETSTTELYLTCISCFSVFEKSKQVNCKVCDWPFCSRRCARDVSHGDLECIVFQQNRVRPTNKAFHYLYLVRILRMAAVYPDKFDHFINLTPYPDCGDEITPEICLDRSTAAAQKFLKRTCDMEVLQSDIWRFKSIITVNAFYFAEGRDPANDIIRGTTGPTDVVGLYATSCLLSHSCAPNIEWRQCSRSEEKPFTVLLIARRDIKAGETVSISYNKTYSMYGTHCRRQGIEKLFGFMCFCPRCMDPTELGTFYSAIKCPECELGWLLPARYFENMESTCNSCKYVLDQKRVAGIETIFRRQLDEAYDMRVDRRVKYLDELIYNVTREHRLHPNHRLVIDAMKQCNKAEDLDILLETSPTSDAFYRKIIQRAEQVYAVVDLFGTTDERIELNCFIAYATIRYNYKSIDYIKKRMTLPRGEEKLEVLRKIVNHLYRSIKDANPFTCDNDEVQARIKIYNVWRSRLKQKEGKEYFKRIGPLE